MYAVEHSPQSPLHVFWQFPGEPCLHYWCLCGIAAEPPIWMRHWYPLREVMNASSQQEENLSRGQVWWEHLPSAKWLSCHHHTPLSFCSPELFRLSHQGCSLPVFPDRPHQLQGWWAGSAAASHQKKWWNHPAKIQLLIKLTCNCSAENNRGPFVSGRREKEWERW